MSKVKTAFVTFFPIKPDTMGSSAVVNSRFLNWPYKKKIFQISHVKKIDNNKIETTFIKKEKPVYKILSLTETIFRIRQYFKKAKKKILIIEGASWIFYSFVVIFFFKFFSFRVKIIYISHSIESEIRKKYSNYFIFYITKFLEKLVFKYSDISTSVSNKEMKKIELLYGVKTVLLPNAIFLKKFTKNKKIKKDYIIFTGSYSYKPNKDAIDYLNNNIMPQLIKKKPYLKLLLTGGGFKKNYPWVINKGVVSKKELYNLIFFSQCLCVPLSFGTGTRIKIIEALCLGAIVISSKKGIEGIQLKSSNPPFVTAKLKNMTNIILEIIRRNRVIKKKSISQKKYYLKKYSMKNVVKKFIYENKI